MWNGTENQITLVFIRHGMTQANKEHRYLGKTEEGLSEEGVTELRKAKAAGRYPQVECVYSSPMQRCLETAELLYPGRTPEIIPEWEEIDFGIFEGKNYAELNGDPRYQAWIDSNGTLPFPEGESREEFMLRCEKGFERMLQKLVCAPGEAAWDEEGIRVVEGKLSEECRTAERTVAVIVHGGTIMSLLSRYYGGEYFDYQVTNGGGYLCKAVNLGKIADSEMKITEIEKL
ncbi:MAG: histidine phosphatase family protein [Lachnospiraceae bacterium]|nr:histidine phosphatase family protein [Lachnospiraceae bacterium]